MKVLLLLKKDFFCNYLSTQRDFFSIVVRFSDLARGNQGLRSSLRPPPQWNMARGAGDD